MRIAVIGSRQFTTPEAEDTVRNFIRKIAQRDPAKGTTIISGGARGVDSWAASQARACGLEVVEHLADWDKHGKGAGFLRNTTIIEDADVVVAFWNGSSKGTMDSVRKARAKGKQVRIVNLCNPPKGVSRAPECTGGDGAPQDGLH